MKALYEMIGNVLSEIYGVSYALSCDERCEYKVYVYTLTAWL